MIKKTCPNAWTPSAASAGEAALVAELAGPAGTANGALSPIASASTGTNTTPALLRTEIPAFHATRTRSRAVSAQPTPGSISYFARPGGRAGQSFPAAGVLQATGSLGSARTVCGCGGWPCCQLRRSRICRLIRASIAYAAQPQRAHQVLQSRPVENSPGVATTSSALPGRAGHGGLVQVHGEAILGEPAAGRPAVASQGRRAGRAGLPVIEHHQRARTRHTRTARNRGGPSAAPPRRRRHMRAGPTGSG